MPTTDSKRIVICSDGTWNDPEDEHPTNVLRMARAVKPVASDGRKQVVFYDWGVGSYHSEVRGGTSGLGMVKNIQDGYRFIVQNYDEGDEIYLFGFSRGAYTVRALAGMLNNCGIVRRSKADAIPDAFKMYKRRNTPPSSTRARDWRRGHAVSPERGPVHFVGVWDTVGALGIPTRVLAFVEERDLFFDSELGSNVRVARHAVSIDEERDDFVPTLWGRKDSADLEEVWFAGVHADVGGGYEPKGGRLLSEIPLAWMAEEARASGLEFERHLYRKVDLDPLAPQNRSRKSFWRLLGKRRRELPADAVVHPSVRKRWEAGDYDSPPLERWLAKGQGTWGS